MKRRKISSLFKFMSNLGIFGSLVFISLGASLIELKNTPLLMEHQIIVIIDGTQLVQETKELVAHYYEVPVILVSASYNSQLLNGKYEYSFNVLGGASGTVEWEIIGGDDQEGVVCED